MWLLLERVILLVLPQHSAKLSDNTWGSDGRFRAGVTSEDFSLKSGPGRRTAPGGSGECADAPNLHRRGGLHSRIEAQPRLATAEAAMRQMELQLSLRSRYSQILKMRNSPQKFQYPRSPAALCVD